MTPNIIIQWSLAVVLASLAFTAVSVITIGGARLLYEVWLQRS